MHPLEQFNHLAASLQEIKDLLAEMNKYRFAEQYIDNDEFIQLLNISKKTAQLWRESGIMPYAQLGKKVYYRLSDLEKLFEKEFKKPKRLKKTPVPARKRLRYKTGNNGWQISV